MIKKFARLLGYSILFIIAAAGVLFLLQPKIPLSPLTQPVSSLLSHLSGKEQVIRGSFFLTPGKWTTISVENGSIILSGSNSFSLKAEIDSARLTVHLWSLIQQKVNLDGVVIDGMNVDLHYMPQKQAIGRVENAGERTRSNVVPFSLMQTDVVDLKNVTASIMLNDSDKKVSLLLEKITGKLSYTLQEEKNSATIQGTIDGESVSLVTNVYDMQGVSPESVKGLPIPQTVRGENLQWQFKGKIPQPFLVEGIVLDSSFSGKSFSSKSDIQQLHIPEIGPCELKGKLSLVQEGYRLEGMYIQIGSSLLVGDIVVETKTVPPRIQVELQSPIIQLDDFEALYGDQTKDKNNTRKIGEDKIPDVKEKKFLTDQEVLESYNAFITIAVDRVLSGEDFLGSGTLKVDQNNGRFAIAPLNLQLPSGKIYIDYSMEPFAAHRLYKMNIIVEDFDYGILGRRFKSDTDISGLITVRTSLESMSPNMKNVMANGTGYIDFAVQPKQLRAGVIDLWAVNLLSYLAPFLTPKGESTINCAAGRLNLKDGILTQDDFLIDTTRIQVRGDIKVDFKNESIAALLRPVPKRPQFYSLSVPIEIEGKFSDLDAGLARGGVIGTIIRLATSYIVVPIQWIIQNRIPEDGTADCLHLVEERTE